MLKRQLTRILIMIQRAIGRQHRFTQKVEKINLLSIGLRMALLGLHHRARSHAMLGKHLLNLIKINEIWFGQDGKSVPSRKSYLSEVKSGVTPVTIWLNDEVGNTHEANNELKSLLGGGVFDNPKPTELIKQILQLSTSPTDGDVVLDFFAGSCTTADALLRLNQEDGGNRKFICIQLPEPVSPPKKIGRWHAVIYCC